MFIGSVCCDDISISNEFRRSRLSESGVVDAGEFSHLVVPCGEVVLGELGEVVMPTGLGHDSHEFGGGFEEGGEAFRQLMGLPLRGSVRLDAWLRK